MAVADASEAGGVIIQEGFGSAGHLVFVSGALQTVSTGPFLYVKRARDSGAGGVTYVTWKAPTTDAPVTPGTSYVGPLTDIVVLRKVPNPNL